jgi:osmotically-inducible protein OsmY
VKAKLTTTYTLNRQLNPFDIKTDVNDGVATLSGTVDSDAEGELAGQIAQNTNGVSDVDRQRHQRRQIGPYRVNPGG